MRELWSFKTFRRRARAVDLSAVARLVRRSTECEGGSAEAEPYRPALVVSAVALGFAIQINNGFHHPVAIQIVGWSLALAWLAVIAPRALGSIVPDRDGVVIGLLTAGLATQLVTLMRAPFAMYVERPLPVDHAGFIPLLMVAALGAGLAALGRMAPLDALKSENPCALVKFLARPSRRLARRRRAGDAASGEAEPLQPCSRVRGGASLGVAARWIGLLLLGAASVGLGIITFTASPDPAIDLITVHRSAFATLAEGKSPYSMTFPDIYQGKESFYPPGAVKDGVVQFGYTYLVMSLLATWVGHLLFGDFRYAELAGLVLGGVTIAVAGRMTSVAVLAVGLLLFTPRVFFQLEQAWTEPIGVLWLGLALWAWRARWMPAAMASLALLVAVKQYLVVAIPLAWLLPDFERPWRDRVRSVIVLGLIVAAIFVPVLIWDAAGFVRSALLVQVNETIRLDSLSLAVDYTRWAGRELPVLAYVAIVVGALVLAAWRAPRTPAGFSAALAVVLFTAFAFGKKAFCNYYFFVIATLCAAIACGDEQRREHEH